MIRSSWIAACNEQNTLPATGLRICFYTYNQYITKWLKMTCVWITKHKPTTFFFFFLKHKPTTFTLSFSYITMMMLFFPINIKRLDVLIGHHNTIFRIFFLYVNFKNGIIYKCITCRVVSFTLIEVDGSQHNNVKGNH